MYLVAVTDTHIYLCFVSSTIELPPETVRDVVLTCVVLHSIPRSQYQGQHGGQQPGGDDDDDVPGDGRLIYGTADCGRDRNPAREAKRLRDYLKDYFNNEGAVAWQDGRTIAITHLAMVLGVK